MALHRAYHRCYDMDVNGELRVMEVLGQTSPAVVFDVGAHTGVWSSLATRCMPCAQIWAFEIVPATAARLAERLRGSDRIQVIPCGLGAAPGSIEVHTVPGNSEVASCVPFVAEAVHGVSPLTVVAEVDTGDRFCDAHGVPRIDLLKIDVEGHEHAVLEGFRNMLAGGRIDVVQFEYGRANIEARVLLRDLHLLLEGHDMVVGKVLPRTVAFGPYRHDQEDFLGPNYLAVRRARPDLIAALS